MIRALLISTLMGFASWDVATAQMPSEAEMRQQLEAGGMTPAQIEEVIGSFAALTPLSGPVKVEIPTPDCEDENENEICDDEEDDSEATRCRVSYLDAVTKFAVDNYGTRLGDDPIGIALTCQAASVNAVSPARLSVLPSSLSGGREFENALEYWDAVMRNGAELSSSLRRRYERIERSPPASRLSKLPSDMRPLAKISDQLDKEEAHVTPAEKKRSASLIQQYSRLAGPVERRCENIRRNVGAYYRAQYPDGAVCLVNVPVTEDELEGEE